MRREDYTGDINVELVRAGAVEGNGKLVTRLAWDGIRH
jgi:hypothetical protein